jgi:hypothetical protein
LTAAPVIFGFDSRLTGTHPIVLYAGLDKMKISRDECITAAAPITSYFIDNFAIIVSSSKASLNLGHSIHGI